MPRRLLAAVLILATAVFVGCRKEKPAPPKNLLEWFQQKQSNTDTPDGRIDVDSASTTDDEWVHYETVKGGVRKSWKMQYRPDGKGGYAAVGEPVEITASP
jgi:hypothetical protein